MIEDAELLRRYARDGSEPAFKELVQRHLPLVYACALRRVHGDAQLAEDVAQLVFADVARRAAQLARYPILAGWLFTSTRFTASKAVRTAQRRLNREQEAYLMHALSSNADPETNWEQARLLLDDAIAELGTNDREAILLRFFEARDYTAIGDRLEISDNAARMRVERALEKLRARLTRRGFASTTAVLATVLSQQASVAVPGGLATSVAGVALAGSGAAGAMTLAGATAVSFMGATKLQVAIASVLIVAGAGTLMTGKKVNAALRDQITALLPQSQDVGELRRENERLKNASEEVAALRADAMLVARLQAQTADLRQQLRTAAQEKQSPIVPRQLSGLTAQALERLKPITQEKRYADALPILDTLIAAVPAESYDMAVVLELKGKICFALEQYPEALDPLEKAVELADKHGYLKAQPLFNDRLMVAALRYQQKRTTNVPTPWFWDEVDGVVFRQPQ